VPSSARPPGDSHPGLPRPGQLSGQGLGGGEVDAVREDGEVSEQALLGLGQQVVGPLEGRPRSYMKSLFTDTLTDEAVATLVAYDEARPTPESLIVIRTLGGAISRVGSDESAYPHRSAGQNVSIDPFWTDPALDDAAIGWARQAWDAMLPFSTGGVYVNFSGLEDEARQLRSAVLGASAARLDRVRADYDPEGLFAVAAAVP
jgi:hypothetical protein